MTTPHQVLMEFEASRTAPVKACDLGIGVRSRRTPVACPPPGFDSLIGTLHRPKGLPLVDTALAHGRGHGTDGAAQTVHL